MPDEQPSLPRGTPTAEIAIDAELVSALLADQHSDLAELPLQAVDEGWDNSMFRLGDHLAVRLPRRAAAAALILHEQTWLPRLRNQLALPVPLPCRVGVPARGYPWHWSVVAWLPGKSADQRQPQPSEASRLGDFLRRLHALAPLEAPENPFRGVPLTCRASKVEAGMQRLSVVTDLITTRLSDVWQAAVQAPIDVSSTWIHGDLHPRNVLVDKGSVTGVIDWGDITSGDCATDLASIWMLFDDAQARADALAAYGPISTATHRRAQGWAVLFGVMLLETGLVDHPQHAAIGEQTLQRLAAAAERLP